MRAGLDDIPSIGPEHRLPMVWNAGPCIAMRETAVLDCSPNRRESSLPWGARTAERNSGYVPTFGSTMPSRSSHPTDDQNLVFSRAYRTRQCPLSLPFFTLALFPGDELTAVGGTIAIRVFPSIQPFYVLCIAMRLQKAIREA